MDDPIPLGYLTLHEAFRLWCNHYCKELHAQQPDRETEPQKWQEWYRSNYQEWYRNTSLRTDEASDLFKRALEQQEFEAVVYSAQHDRFFRITPTDIAFPLFHLIFWSEKISALNDSPLRRYDGKTALVEEKAFRNWFDHMAAAADGERITAKPQTTEQAVQDELRTLMTRQRQRGVATDHDNDSQTWWPDPELVRQWMREGHRTELPSTQLVTLTEAATWLMDGIVLDPGEWNRVLLRIEIRRRTLNDLWFRSDPLVADRDGYGIKLEPAMRDDVRYARDWWQSCIQSFEAQVSGAALFILENAASHHGEVRGRSRGASESAPLLAQDLHKPLKFDASRNMLVFDQDRSTQLASTFLAEDCEWTDMAVTAEAVRTMRQSSASQSPREEIAPPAIPAKSKSIRGYAELDEELLQEMRRIIDEEKISDYQAALRVASKARGGGTPESKAMRLVRRLQNKN